VILAAWYYFSNTNVTAEGTSMRGARLLLMIGVFWAGQAPLLPGIKAWGQEQVKQFDFGTAESPVFQGFVGVHPESAYDKAAGFGWGEHGVLQASDKKDANDLQRDFCYGYATTGALPAHFLVDLPDGKYWAAFFAGDIQYSRADTPMDILIGGAKVVDAWKVSGWDWRVAEFEVKDGQSDIVFQSSQAKGQRYSFWLVNGLIIYRGGTREAVTAKVAKLSSDVQEAHILKQFKEQMPEPDKDAAPITAQDKEQGYIAFARALVRIVYPTTLPTAQEREDSLRCFCTPGSYTHVTFGVVPLKDLGECAVSVSELKCNGNSIPASAWKTYLARISRERVGLSASKVFRWQPKVLDPTVKARMDGGKTRWWWLTLHVPDGQPAGSYTGEVMFAPEGGSKHVFPVSVQVYPFKLRQPPGEVFGMYWAKHYVMYPQNIRKQFADLREHGCNGITMDLAPKGGFGEQGKLELDFSEMDEIIKMAQEEGLTSPIPWNGASRISSMLKDKLDSEEGRRQYKEIVAAIVAHGKQSGWPPILFYPVDEPPKEAIMKYLPLIKEVPGALTYCTPNNVEVGLATVQYMDYACWQHQSAREDTREATLKAGKTFWYYSSNYGENSLTARVRSGFLRWRLGATGMYYWHYQAPHGDPYNALDAKVTDHCVAYPTPEGPIPSIGWEGEREGIDDYKYVKMLEELIAAACAGGASASGGGPDNPKAKRAQATLEKLRTEIPPDGKKVLQVPEAFTFESFDQYRREIAGHIVGLLEETKQ
jgi:hypothetical protein